MLEQIKLPRQHINAFHLDQSLLFQFILSELLIASHEIEIVTRLAPRLLLGNHEELAAPITQLAGFHQEYMRLFAWHPSDGILAKLKSYCSYFEQLSAPSEKRQFSMLCCAEQAWLQGLQSLNYLRMLQDGSVEPSLSMSLHRSLNRLVKSFKRLAQLAIKTIETFHDDENVIFFVLRQREQFDEAFGNGFVKKLFKKMYAGNIQEASDMVTEKYARRGFYNLLPLINTKFSDL